MSIELDEQERRALRRKVRDATLGALSSLGGEARRDVMCARALRDGGFTPRELAAAPPVSAKAGCPRLVDHLLSWAPTELKRDGLVENPAWGVWRLSGAALETPARAAPKPDGLVGAERLAELRSMPYRHYLRTPEWRVTRSGALLRAGWRCSLDVTHGEDLDVHHRTYERLGAELASDLVVLCRPCHRLHHREHGRPRRAGRTRARRKGLLLRLLGG